MSRRGSDQQSRTSHERPGESLARRRCCRRHRGRAKARRRQPGSRRGARRARRLGDLARALSRPADIAEVLLAAAPALDAFDATAAGDLGRLSEVIAADKGAAAAFSADGFTALHFAAFFTQEKAAELLVDAGADVNAVSRNAMRVCPPHSAAAVRAAAIVGLLLAHGADPNRAQHGGWTPLHEAAAHGDMACLEALLAHGARRDVRLDDGRTPADLARDNKAAAALARLEAA